MKHMLNRPIHILCRAHENQVIIIRYIAMMNFKASIIVYNKPPSRTILHSVMYSG